MFSTGPYKYNRFDLLEKKADKDYDGDGKVESGKEEYFGSKDKAIKKAMGNCPDGKCGKCPKCQEKKEEFNSSVKALIDEGVDFSEYTWDELYEGYISEGLPPALLKAIMKKKGGKGKEVKENHAMANGGHRLVGDGSKPRAPKNPKNKTQTMMGKDGKPLFAKEDIGQYLMDKGYANNSVSADIIAEHMSQEWLDQIIEID